MRRRILAPACLGMACAVFASSGCDSMRSARRDVGFKASSPKADDEVEAVDGRADKILAVDSDPKKPSQFFKNSRKTGGLSDEARDIESSLGVR